jgi:hypothetical protein
MMPGSGKNVYSLPVEVFCYGPSLDITRALAKRVEQARARARVACRASCSPLLVGFCLIAPPHTPPASAGAALFCA